MDGSIKNSDFLQALEENKGIIYKVSRAYCQHDEERKDLNQEIIIQIWRSFDKYRNQYRISTFIYRIALNVAISFYRKSLIRQKGRIPLTMDMVGFISDRQPEDKSDEIFLLYRCIHELKEIDRALMLLYLEDKNYDEIAEILDISRTNVATKIGRIKSLIRDKFLIYKNEL